MLVSGKDFDNDFDGMLLNLIEDFDRKIQKLIFF